MIQSCHLKRFLTFAVLLVMLSPFVLAADLSLTKIGSLSTNGAAYSEWWYTGTNPVISGTAEAGEDVEITVGSEKDTVTADSAGNWTYSLTGTGDVKVSLVSGGDSYSFTIHLGQSVPTGTTKQTTPSKETTTPVPGTGSTQLFGLTAGLSMVLIGLFVYIRAKKNTKEAYAKEVLKTVDKL